MPISATAFHGSRHLTESDLMPPADTCPICLTKSSRRVAVRVQTSPDVSFLVCGNCRGASASRMPTPAAIQNYYSTYYAPSATERITFASPHLLAKLVARHVKPKTQSQTRILDIGGGDGTIALHCARLLMEARKARSVEIIVVDAVVESASPPPPGITLAFTAEVPASGEFDIVLASAVLEHIPELRAAFDTMLGKLAPDGVFYARTPHVLPFATRVSIDMTYPAHVHDVGAACWDWLRRNAKVKLDVLVASPSIIETSLRTNPPRWATALVLKSPARLLAAMGAPALWPFYGGWQVVWRRAADER